VQKVLQQLLREQVSIRDLSTILRDAAGYEAISKNPVLLVEVARQALGRALVRPLLSEDGGLRVLTLDHTIEEGTDPRLQSAAAANGQRGIAAVVRAENFGQPAPTCRRASGADRSRIVVFHPGAFSFAPVTRTLPSKIVVALSAGNTSMVPVQSLGTVR